MKITIKDGEKYFVAIVSPKWAERHNNYALISCGLTVGHDLSPGSWSYCRRRFKVTEITHDEYNHSGCLSGCIRRGDPNCRW